jgi:hypothetical protein
MLAMPPYDQMEAEELSAVRTTLTSTLYARAIEMEETALR